ncbi:hypothetical protein [Streptomyces sp. NPDC093225]|uniref:hypothetical protein n=1 Tax=Streptomyces sp. NPDC093225 TaxID=3366034 RepID=UPI00381B2EC0
MRINGTLRAAAAPVLLLAAAAAGAGSAAAAPGPEFQYVGADDRVHAATRPAGCVEAVGAPGTGVVNHTAGEAVLYRGPGCTGAVLGRVPAGGSAPTSAGFGSVEFAVTR